MGITSSASASPTPLMQSSDCDTLPASLSIACAQAASAVGAGLIQQGLLGTVSIQPTVAATAAAAVQEQSVQTAKIPPIVISSGAVQPQQMPADEPGTDADTEADSDDRNSPRRRGRRRAPKALETSKGVKEHAEQRALQKMAAWMAQNDLPPGLTGKKAAVLVAGMILAFSMDVDPAVQDADPGPAPTSSENRAKSKYPHIATRSRHPSSIFSGDRTLKGEGGLVPETEIPGVSERQKVHKNA